MLKALHPSLTEKPVLSVTDIFQHYQSHRALMTDDAPDVDEEVLDRLIADVPASPWCRLALAPRCYQS